jgi:hypothetical protein
LWVPATLIDIASIAELALGATKKRRMWAKAELQPSLSASPGRRTQLDLGVVVCLPGEFARRLSAVDGIPDHGSLIPW